MKVLLVNPPVDNSIGLELPVWIRHSEGAFPPLGLMYLASYLQSHSSCEVKIVDAVAGKMRVAEITRLIQKERPDIVGITAHTHNLIDAISVAAGVKRADSRAHVCLGGPHVTVFPRESIGIEHVDSIVAGEGEVIFADLVKCIAARGDLKTVKGIMFKREGAVVETEQAECAVDLDSLPFPGRTLVDNEKYHSILGHRAAMATVASSRGCPYRCSFCSTPKGPLRMRSAGNVVREMEECLRLGLGEIHFIDDTFNADERRVAMICEGIRERRLRIKWSFRGRIDKLSLSLLKKAKEAGCYRIHVGVETSTDEGLRGLHKDITVGQIRQVFQWMRQARISTVAYFLIGCPHEKNRDEVMRTVGFSREIGPDFALFNILTPYPGTPLYEAGLARGMFGGDVWRDFAVDPRKDFQPPCWHEWFSREELDDLLAAAYESFYFRMGFMGKMLVSMLRNPTVFFKRAAAGSRILFSMVRRREMS